MKPLDNSPLELIYLFLDGEADDSQKEILFQALASDSFIQHHFQEAVNFGKMIESEVKTTSPPVDLTQKLFAKAGIRPVISPTGFWERTGLPKAGANLIRNRYMLLLSGFVAGVVMTVIWINPFISENKANYAGNSMHAGLNNRYINKPLPFSPQVKPSENGYFNKNGTLVLNSTSSGTIAGHSSIQETAVSEPEINEPVNNIGILTKASINYVRAHIQTCESFEPVSLIELSKEFTTQPGLSLEIKGSGDIAQYPARIRTDGNNVPDNFGAGIYYTPNGRDYFGVEYSSEKMMIFQKSNPGSYDLKDNLIYFSIGYRHKFQSLTESIDLSPYCQANLGWTSSGPLAKGTAGMSISPAAILSFRIGIESGALGYQDRKNIKAAWKTGLYLGLSLNL